MKDRINNQKDILSQLHHEASLLKQQLDFLIRNEKELRLLDLDVLMNRTHSIYEMLCSINLSGNDANDEVESFDPMALLGGLFNIDDADSQEPLPSEEEPYVERQERNSEEDIISSPIVDDNESEKEAIKESETISDIIYTNQIVEEIVDMQDTEPSLSEEHIIKDNTETEQTETHEVLGEVIAQEDNSLATSLQHKPIEDIKQAIGINDKYLLVNELFAGSMEKYNRSIDNLNDLKTLDGALIYLNELKIELQWNSSNEAYKKLNNLVRRKFE